MQATEQTTTLDAEKEWEILNQLAEIAADIENQTSYCSFQLEEGNQISDTLLVDVNSWISQLQSLVPNTSPKEVVAVVLPNPTHTASISESQKESAEASSDNNKEIDEKFLKNPARNENGADSSTYLGAVAEAVAQELQGNPTAGFENADALDDQESNKDILQSTDHIKEDDEELASINQAIEQAEQIEAQPLSKVQLNPELENERESNTDEVEEEIEEEEAESWFHEELAEEEEALSHKDSGPEEINPESLLLQETDEPLQVVKTEGEDLSDENADGSKSQLDTTDATENLGKVETSEDDISDSQNTTIVSAEAQPVDPEENIKDDKFVLSRVSDDIIPDNEPVIDDDSESPETSRSSETLVSEDKNEPLEILTPSEVELLASEASHGGVIDKEQDSEDEEDFVVELDLESEEDLTEEDPQNPAIQENIETTTQITEESDQSDQPTTDHENLHHDFAPESALAEIENTKIEGETSDSQEYDSKFQTDEVDHESSEIDDLQEISVEEDEVEEDRGMQGPEKSEDVLTDETVGEEAEESPDTQPSQTTNSDWLGGSVNVEENSENAENNVKRLSSGDEHQDVVAQQADSKREIIQETKYLRELESLDSSDAILTIPETVSDSSTGEIANPTDLQDEQSIADLPFLQGRYNRIANAALEEGKLELAKECYDSLAKILKLMK